MTIADPVVPHWRMRATTMATMKLCVTPGGPSPFVLNREKTYLFISVGVTSWGTSWSWLAPARLAVSVPEVDGQLALAIIFPACHPSRFSFYLWGSST